MENWIFLCTHLYYTLIKYGNTDYLHDWLKNSKENHDSFDQLRIELNQSGFSKNDDLHALLDENVGWKGLLYSKESTVNLHEKMK